jgi:peptidoglycan hydrolase-like protein with peptidoglycan-binding domain
MAVRRGQKGAAVKQVQEALVANGYYIGEVDSDFGPKTEAAVMYLQSCHGQEIDGKVGEQTYVVLGIQPGTVSSLEVTLPDIDVLDVTETNEYAITVAAEDDMWPQARVVGWFRGPGGETHTEETIELSAGSTTFARLTVPEIITAQEGEVHVTVYVFDMQGTQLEEQFSSFRVNRPDAI